MLVMGFDPHTKKRMPSSASAGGPASRRTQPEVRPALRDAGLSANAAASGQMQEERCDIRPIVLATPPAVARRILRLAALRADMRRRAAEDSTTVVRRAAAEDDDPGGGFEPAALRDAWRALV